MHTLKWLGRQLVGTVPPVIAALAALLIAHWTGTPQAAAVATALVVYGAASYTWLTLYNARRARRATPLPTPTPEA